MENNMTSTLLINILGEDYTTSSNILLLYNITSDRLKKWRDGRGVIKDSNITIRTFKLNKSNYLYNIKDLERIIDLHILSLEKIDQTKNGNQNK